MRATSLMTYMVSGQAVSSRATLTIPTRILGQKSCGLKTGRRTLQDGRFLTGLSALIGKTPHLAVLLLAKFTMVPLPSIYVGQTRPELFAPSPPFSLRRLAVVINCPSSL